MVVVKSTLSRTVRIENLSPHSFQGFGEVIQNPSTHDGQPTLEQAYANQGSAVKWLDVTHMHNFYDIAPSKKAAKAVVNMFVCKPRALEESSGPGQSKVFKVKILERHPFTPQTFVPVGLGKDDAKTCYLVIVAPTLKSTRSGTDKANQAKPPYPIPLPKRKTSLRERLLGARPNPFTNDFVSRTTTLPFTRPNRPLMPKGPGSPDLENIQAFVARGDQAVTYGAGTWHAPMVVLGEQPIDFVVVQYANGVGTEDCQEVEIAATHADAGIEVILDDLDSRDGGSNRHLSSKL